MTDQADFYCCLPIVSCALGATFSKIIDKDEYLTDIPPEDGPHLIASATRLRNSSLFKECVVLCAGPWKDSGFMEKLFRARDPNESHFSIIEQLYTRISGELATLH